MSNFENFLFIAVLISRIGDIGTTYLATPKLKLEANPFARKFRWPFALASLLLCLLPYYSPPLAIIALVASLLVSASNASKLWVIRAMGEDRFYNLMIDLAGNSKVVPSVMCMLAPPIFISMLSGSLMFFYPDPTDWGYYFAYGIATYALVMFIYGPLFYFKLRRRAMQQRTSE